MENCSDGFNVPRKHTAKLYIVGKRIMGSIGKKKKKKKKKKKI
jgi:hypothetical protein